MTLESVAILMRNEVHSSTGHLRILAIATVPSWPRPRSRPTHHPSLYRVACLSDRVPIQRTCDTRPIWKYKRGLRRVDPLTWGPSRVRSARPRAERRGHSARLWVL